MLTVAYCRVSTDEQAADGFSIEGQAEKLRAYAGLRDLGDVTFITDPGRSGKDMKRPGLQQLLYMVDQGHVAAILICGSTDCLGTLGTLSFWRTRS